MLWAFSLQMLSLHSFSPLRRVYLSDFSCMRILGRFLPLLFEESTFGRLYSLPVLTAGAGCLKMVPLPPLPV